LTVLIGEPKIYYKVREIQTVTNITRNPKKIQKSLNFPKKPKISKKAKFWIILAFLKFLAILANFGQIIPFLANFGFILAFLENFGLHVAYIGGTYRVLKS
jgi:hypothetical protein